MIPHREECTLLMEIILTYITSTIYLVFNTLCISNQKMFANKLQTFFGENNNL